MKKKLIISVASSVLFLLGLLLLTNLLSHHSLLAEAKQSFYNSDEQASLTDSIRINKLNKEALILRHNYPLKTINKADSALALAKKINYFFGIAEANRIKGIGHYYLNNMNLAVKSYVEALKYFKLIKDSKNEAKVYNNIGNLYKDINYQKSLEYYKKALNISRGQNDEELIAGLYFNIASAYQKSEHYKDALFYFEKSNKIFLKSRDTISILLNFLNTGIVYSKIKNYDEAEVRLIKAIEGSQKNKLYNILTESYITLASINIEKELFSEANKNIQEGLKYSKIENNLDLKQKLLYIAYSLEQRRKNYPKALEYLKKVYQRDSLLLSENKSDNIGKTSSYYSQLQKIQENELIIARQKFQETKYWWILTLIISIVLLTIIISLFIFFMLQRRKRKRELEIQSTITTLEQKALRATMNPHFIFNVMNSIQYFIGIRESKAALQLLTGFARLIRKHLELCLKNTITLNEEIHYLNLYLSLEKIRFAEKMNYSIHIDRDIETEEIMIPSMLIQPFIENSIWHGLMPKENGGFINLDFKYHNNYLTISIKDNGIGITNSIKTKTQVHISRGLDLIKERVKLLNLLNETYIQISQSQTGKTGTVVIIKIAV